MRFIDDDQVRAVKQEQVLVAVALQEIDVGDLRRIVPVDALHLCLTPLKLIDRAGADHHGFHIELLGEFLLPLLARVRRAEHAEAPDPAAVVQLAGDEQRLDGLAHTDVVRNQQAHGVQSQGHQHRDELVGAAIALPTRESICPCCHNLLQLGRSRTMDTPTGGL
jgi:hypothetical protein